MKILIWSFVFVLSDTFIHAQNVDSLQRNDTLRRTFLTTKLLYDDPDKKSIHIIDYEWGHAFANYGYNYFYRLNPRWYAGARIGTRFFRESRYMDQNDLIMPLKIEALINHRLYRSINAEVGVGYYSYFNLSDNTNGINNLIVRTGINITLLKYLFFRTSFGLSYGKDTINSYSNSGISVSIGLKF